MPKDDAGAIELRERNARTLLEAASVLLAEYASMLNHESTKCGTCACTVYDNHGEYLRWVQADAMVQKLNGWANKSPLNRKAQEQQEEEEA